MQLKEISLSDFYNFSKGHDLYNFYQSVGMAKSQSKRNMENFVLGLFNDQGEILAATLCFITKNKKFIKVMNVNYGFLIDFSNHKLFQSFMKQFIVFCRSKHVSRLVIHPYLLGYSYDDESPHKVDHSVLEDQFKQFGFIQNEPIVDYTKLVNLMFVKDLTPYETFGDVKKSFQPNLQRLINKALDFDVQVSLLKESELDRYYKIESSSARKNNVTPRDFAYYKSIFQGYSDIGEVIFLIATLNIDQYREKKLQAKAETIKKIEDYEKRESLSRKQTNQLKAQQEILSGINNRLGDIDDINESGVLDIGGCLAFKNDKEITVLEIGQHEEFERFSPTSLIYYKLMEYAFGEKIYRFNFYGTYDIDQPKTKGYNIYQYKRRFGGELEQLIPGFKLDLNFLARFI